MSRRHLLRLWCPYVGAIALVTAVLLGCSPDERSDVPHASSATTATTTGASTASTVPSLPQELVVERFAVPAGSRPHDVAPAPDGTVWYTAQAVGRLGRLDPATGDVTEYELGPRSRPHGVIVGPDGAPWITDGGRNAIVRVDPTTEEVTAFPLPATHPSMNLNTAVFTPDGTQWFTGQGGIYGRLAPGATTVEVLDAPGGAGPYGITATPDGKVFYASLAGDHIAEIDTSTAAATVLRPPTADQGSRRVWSDSQGRIWCSQWDAGQVAVYDPTSAQWREWPLPGDSPQAYAVFVDEHDRVWLSDWGSNSLVVFDPETETFRSVALPDDGADVRQILGRPGEVWAAESGADALVVVRTSAS